MLIWLLAIVVIASTAGMGYRQGAIRVAFSLAGILLGAFLAGPLGSLLHKPLHLIGVQNPAFVWVLAPFIVFVAISIAAKAAAYPVHHKVDVYFKYRAGDLRMVLWERLSRRVGLCLGVLNGTVYFLLISMVIYSMSYWTVQMATPDADPPSIKWLNRFGNGLEDSGFIRVARSLDAMPDAFYDAADVAGIIYQNSLIEARLSLYPGLLGVAERPEFQALASSKEFAEMRQTQKPINEVLNDPTVASIVQNPDLVQSVWSTLMPDLKDLETFLQTGKSPKYDPIKVIGRWDFNANAAYVLVRKARPNLTSKDARAVRTAMLNLGKINIVATADQQATLKNAPGPQKTIQGQWKDLDGKYELVFPDADVVATIDNDRMTFPWKGTDWVFDRED